MAWKNKKRKPVKRAKLIEHANDEKTQVRKAKQKIWRDSHIELIRAYARKYAAKVTRDDPDKLRRYRRDYHLKSAYGISLNEYKTILARQGGLCAVCRQPETAIFAGKVKSLDVDHCHRTGAVRGILCSSCNIALGRLNEDPLRIRALLDYVERFDAPSE